MVQSNTIRGVWPSTSNSKRGVRDAARGCPDVGARGKHPDIVVDGEAVVHAVGAVRDAERYDCKGVFVVVGGGGGLYQVGVHGGDLARAWVCRVTAHATMCATAMHVTQCDIGGTQ